MRAIHTHLIGQQLMEEIDFSVQAVAVTRPSSPCTPRALIGVGLTDRCNLQGVHANSWIEHLQLAKP